MPDYNLDNLREFASTIPAAPDFSGRGVVISAGGPYIHLAYLAVRSLRTQGCNLRIQIWHLGKEEFPTPFQKPFQKLEVEFVDSFEI